MKKILALVLAVVMTMGLASVALAADDPVLTVESSAVLYKYDSDVGYGKAKGNAISYGSSSTELLTPGSTYYISIAADWGSGATSDPKDTSLAATPAIEKSVASKYKVFGEWKVGKIDNMSLEYKKINAGIDSTTTFYAYVISFTIPESDSVSLSDIGGAIKVAKTASAAKNLDGIDVGFQAGYGTRDPKDSSINIQGTSVDDPIVKFTDLDEVDITWGSDEVALFTVNVAGQSKLNLAYSLSYNAAFGAKYDYANIDFVTFKKSPSFNRTGELYIYAEEGTYIYEVGSDNTAKAIANAVYDEDYGAWKIKTRTLAAYAISDKELRLEAASSSEEPVESSSPSEAPSDSTASKPNPNTGR